MKKGDPFCLSKGCNDTISCHFFECFPQLFFETGTASAVYITAGLYLQIDFIHFTGSSAKKQHVFFIKKTPGGRKVDHQPLKFGSVWLVVAQPCSPEFQKNQFIISGWILFQWGADWRVFLAAVWNASRCTFFKYGRCQMGSSCRHAHFESELRSHKESEILGLWFRAGVVGWWGGGSWKYGDWWFGNSLKRPEDPRKN